MNIRTCMWARRYMLGFACGIVVASPAFAGSFLDYNVVATGTLTINSQDIQGRTFVNNLAVSNQPDFAQSSAAGTGDTLTVAGSISGSGLTLERGVFRHAGNLPQPFTLNLNGGSSQVQDSSVSIASLASQLSSAASYFNSLAATGVSASGGNLAINASGSGVAVFAVSAADLQNQNENVQINVNSASAVIIKVIGSSLAFGTSEHQSISGSSQNVMWYFPTASSVLLNDSTWNGSILALQAGLSSPTQAINGGVYVQTFNQGSEVHLPSPGLAFGSPMFAGPIVPGVAPALSALAMFGLSAASGRGRWFTTFFPDRNRRRLPRSSLL
jgi:choice-of-anchor A domain-containing protein